MILKNINLGSINPTNNPFFCSDEWKEGIFLCVGCFYFEINKKHELLYLNNQTSEKEDYIRTIQHYNIYGKVLRVNLYCVKHKYNKSKKYINRIFCRCSCNLNIPLRICSIILNWMSNITSIFISYSTYNFKCSTFFVDA